ncbi:YsnF/AvaK domain-containing protein [Devosia sp. 1566]|uniref:YsnF/AvaK domain-containing protein n=1 Tax=Devosia sp. 1566 TaxID=2499144 RepID=UPI000FD96209|nr:YsnF/AvaK domain-containing protein [Devosia sp. 1566]
MSQFSATGAERTLSAFFDSRSEADRAVERLIDAGISRDNVRLVPGYENDEPVQNREETHRGFFASLADFFMPDEDRYTYAEGLSRGGYLVTVSDLDSTNHDTALDILDDEGAIDLDEREESWRTEGWTGYTTDYSGTARRAADSTNSSGGTLGAGTTSGSTLGASGVGATTTSDIAGSTGSAGYASTSQGQTTSTSGAGYTDRTTSEFGTDEVIPVVEEELRVGKRDVNLGRVRVRSYVREEPVSANVNLYEERVTIERRPVDRALGAGDAAFQDRTIEAEEHAEEAVVDKQARVTEEISLRKEGASREETISDTVRKTEVEVEDDRNTGLGDRKTSI